MAESIGDVKSDARGSGARYITGKPDLSLVTVRLQSVMWFGKIPKELARSLDYLAQFQETHQLEEIFAALRECGEWLDEAAHVLTYGTKKYAAWNWAKGMQWSACMGCAMRHVEKIAKGQEFDDESGRHHMGHYVCNLLFLAHYAMYYPEGNDLPPPSIFAEPARIPTADELERLTDSIPTPHPEDCPGGCGGSGRILFATDDTADEEFDEPCLGKDLSAGGTD